MRVVITGTPSTGKTTATERVTADLDLDVVHPNRLMKDEDLWTERNDERDTLVVDPDAARDKLGDWDGIVGSHLAHHFETGRVIVLRCWPDILEQRFLDRGEIEAKARENRESEALSVILGEAVEFHNGESVYRTDITGRDPDAVADDIAAVATGERGSSAGTVDFIDHL